MAQTDALSIFQANGTDEEKLAEAYAAIPDQIQKASLAVLLKAQGSQLSGDPLAGSVVVRRLMTSTVKTYGTARSADEGDKIKNNGVVVNLDVPKEIVEEVNQWDLNQFGLPGIIERRATNFALAMASHLDTAFFTEAEAEGTETTVNGETAAAELEDLIQAVETTTNDNVDGVDRSMIAVTLKPATYGALANYIDTLPNPVEGGVDIQAFHGVRVYSNHRQTKDAIAMVVGSIAQPVAVIDFKQDSIPLSADTALMLFFKYGTEAVMPDLIRWADLADEVSA